MFFDTLGVQFSYEPETISLSSGAKYIPDFFIKDFDAYFEVKPPTMKSSLRKQRKPVALLTTAQVSAFGSQ